ncbi:GH92 family glycosyl hydrolase [Rugosimonospora africana]|uniref:Alpha-1,2-mannosidase n=1 Tax=Rugosimonospora africana TaxID=556532 RepID=A0A8J3VR93_9ACTN|nr:GH92 family glycosyl hydrolase [Rugosimonospora africana]GIH15852.1 hypothetical protein Raf01_40240 [Rugosimonospora africana]
MSRTRRVSVFGRTRRASTGAGAGLLGLTVVAALAAPAVPASAATGAAAALVDHPVTLVDPFIGTGSGGDVVGDVDAFPGATAPFGMVQWSPDTPGRPAGGGYRYTDSSITGFSLTHLSGVGCSIAGDVPFLPTVGVLPADPSSASVAFSHANESASPGRYRVGLDNGVTADLTATARTGLGELTYPRTDRANLLVKVAGSANGGAGATFAVAGDREVTGQVSSGRFCGQPDSYTLYFAARFDRPFAAHGTWGGTAAGDTAAGDTTAGDTASGTVAGGYVSFDTRNDPVVGVRVAVSYVSVAGAEANLRAEAGTWDVDRQAAATAHDWDTRLRAIRIGGGTADQRRTFYTALYHAMLMPTVFSDADGRYRGFDGAVHTLPRGQAQYANYSGWDIYRSEIPLLAAIAPDVTSQLVSSLVRDAAQGGWLPKWPVAAGYTGVMNGDPAGAIIASAYAFGARGFDTAAALAAMRKGAEDTTSPPGQGWYVERPSLPEYLERGYVPNTGSSSISPLPNGASETLEYAVDDFAISRLASAVGDRATAARYLTRSQNWSNVFDTATGYAAPRDADGAFPPGPGFQDTGGFGQNGFQEGNAAQYTWMVPQNLRGVIQGIGGDAAAIARLDDYFTQLNAGPDRPYHWQGNEPTFGTPYAYLAAGAPWKTQETVRRIETQLYAPTPGGEPGNDDCGAMSSWYVWSALGVYPQTPGVPALVVGSPLFPRAEVDLGAGRELSVTAPAAATANPYVHGLRVNGAATQRTWIALPGKGRTTLSFDLSPAPDHHWGTATGARPPSYPAGPVRFPAATRAFLRTDPAQLRLAPGGSTSGSVVVDNTQGTVAATVSWSVTAPDGLTVTPTGATVTAAAGAAASLPVTVSARSDLAAGYYSATVTGTGAGGAVLARTGILVTVAAAGQRIPTAYVSNYSDATLTPVDVGTHTAGPPIPVGSGPDGVALTPDGAEAYVANNNSNDVTVIDTATNAVTATVPVGSIAASVVAQPDGRTVWVSNFGDGTVQSIATATHTASAPVRVGANPQRLTLSPDGSQLWVPNQGSGTVSVVDTATGAVTHTVTVGAQPFDVAFAPDAAHAYVTNTADNTVSVVDTATWTATATIPAGGGPQAIRLTPDHRTLYVADSGSGGVTPIDVASGAPGAFIPTGAGAYAIGFGPDGATAWVVDTGANDVATLDVATGMVTGHVRVGNAPDGIGITPHA